MLTEFISHIERRLPFLKDAKLLLACSGGLDSVVLSVLAKDIGLDFALVHCNFQLRGQESDDDAKFVENFAKELKVKYFLKAFETESTVEASKGSTQMVARELRYAWFAELIEKEGYEYVLTAHHANDSLETFLINLSRGTGIEGLKGIPEQNGKILRPLLPFARKSILEFAKKENLSWREDSSNTETKYLRNQIRHQVIPELEQLTPNLLNNFLKTQARIQGSTLILQRNRKQLQDELFVRINDAIKISIDELTKLEPQGPYLHLLFQEFGFTAWQDILYLLTAESGKEVWSSTHRLLKDRDYLLLCKLTEKSEITNEFSISEDLALLAKPLKLKIETVDSVQTTSKNIIYLDKDMLNYPLVLRRWHKGDYFYPFGMKGKKKLSKYFKDEKLSIIDKENQWLLCSSGEIAWVVGKRADDRFKVLPKTKHIVKITWHKE